MVRVKVQRTRQADLAEELRATWKQNTEPQDCTGRPIQVRDLVQFENSRKLTTVGRVTQVRGRKIFVEPFWMSGVRREFYGRWLPIPEATKLVPEGWV